MWELAVISLVLLLLILVLVIVACWITSNNCCKKNKRSIELLELQIQTGLAALQASQAVCCAKAFLTVVGAGTVDRGPTGLIKLVNWDAQPANELPDNGWTPVISTIDQSLIGWTVPTSGTYSIYYSTSITTDVCVANLLVNGLPWFRSVTASAWDPSSPTPTPLLTQNLAKTFLINLVKGEVLSIVIFNLAGPGITPPATGAAGGGFVHSLTCDLRDASSQSTDNGPDAAPEPSSVPGHLLQALGGKESPAPRNVEEWAASPLTQLAAVEASGLVRRQRDASGREPKHPTSPVDLLIAALAPPS